jgi:signal transduction histidine kinase/CheY-like chemotaxis protein
MQQGNTVLAIISYIGGFSAATGMVIVAAITLSTMVSNDLIFPLILRYLKTEPGQDFSRILLLIRRTTILTLLMLAYGYYHISASNIPLYSIGLLSFAAAVQFMPAIIGGLYWKQGHRNGAFWGLSAGFVIWLYTLLLPSLVNFPLMPEDFVRHGFLGQAWLSPNALFGSSFNDYLTHGVFWSLLFNITFYVGISLRSQANFTDRLQASSYVDQTENLFEHTTTSKADFRMQDLYELCSRFTGEDRTTRFFLEHGYDMAHVHATLADQNSIKLAEHLLASSIGSATAEQLIRTAVSSNTSNQELFHLLGTTGEALQFNREILQVAIDNINQGVSVVDRDLCITAWNRTYIELFDYPNGFLHVGKPIEDVIRFNAKRGLGAMSTTQHEDEVNKRMNYLRHGEPYTFVRYWQDGRVIQTRGARMPDGGFITTFTDITELKQAEKELEAINLNLERKVEQRTEMLSTVNKELQQAKHLAEDATRSKTHFLAAASHDLTQPLGAAKLYMGALLEDVSGDKSKEDITRNALSALQTAESLLKSLLDISKLQSSALIPEITRFPIWQLFQSIQTEFSVLAKEKNLNLRVVSSRCGTATDKTLLRSILQNFLTNAIRYTESGSIMVLCRRSGENHIRIEVRDSGSGIPVDKIEDIFMEFKQLNHGFNEGAGLGLAICKHAAQLLGLELKVASRVGEGSTFSITVPRVNVEETTSPIIDNRHFGKRWLEGIRILCVDDDQNILGATRTLLDRWGASTACVDRPDNFYELIREDANFDVILMDYQLHADSNGLELLELYREISNRDFLGILVTAEQGQALRERTIAEGYLFLPLCYNVRRLKTRHHNPELIH